MKALPCFIVFCLLINAQSYVIHKENYNVCTTASCNASAQYLLSSMNRSVVPCDNFYEYACGGWVEKNQIFPFMTAAGVTVTLTIQAMQDIKGSLETLKDKPNLSKIKSLNMAAKVFDNCMNAGPETEAALLKDIRRELRDIGGWPIMDPKWDGSKFDIFKSLAFVRRKYNLELGIKVSVGPDVTTGERNIIHVQTPFSWKGSSFLPRYERRSTDEDIFNMKNKLELFKDLVCWINPNCTRDTDFEHEGGVVVGLDQSLDLLLMFSYSGMQPQTNNFKVMTDMKQKSREDLTSFQDMHKSPYYSLFEQAILDNPENFKKSVKDVQDHLQKENVTMNLLDFLNDLLSDSGRKITAEDQIYVVPESLTLMAKFVESDTLRKKDWANFIAYKVVASRLLSVSTKYRTMFRESNREKAFEPPPHWLLCITEVDQLMPFSIGRIYAENHFTEEKKKEAEELVENLRQSAKELLYDALGNWMDPETHQKAVKKLTNIQESVGYPEWIKNDTVLNSYYDIDEKNVSGPLDLVRKLSKKQFDLDFRNIFGPVDRKNDGWKISSPMTVNAFYFPPLNIIVFPGAFINFPVFALDRPKALNYGGIGWIIGHEITHGFDDAGRRFDFQGRIHDWWTPESAKRFNALTTCFIDQYSNITSKDTGKKLDGLSTLGENIADNGGLRESFKAHRRTTTNDRLPGIEDMDQDQLFFLSAANMWCSKTRPGFMDESGQHSPERYRVQVPFMNNADFARAFNCPLGSPMNPEKKCVLW